MIIKCANKMTEWLVQRQVIEDSDRELYEYATISLLTTLFPFMLTIIIGLLMKRLVESMVIIIPFMLIRKFSGGFHAKRMLTCLISSTILLTTFIYLSMYIHYGAVSSIWLIVSIFVLIVNSPIESENYRLEAEEKHFYKLVVIGMSIAFLAVYVILGIYGYGNYGVCISLGVNITAILQWIIFF